jgi:hypothetical protein
MKYFSRLEREIRSISLFVPPRLAELGVPHDLACVFSRIEVESNVPIVTHKVDVKPTTKS